MSTTYDLPMPGERIFSRVVVASVWTPVADVDELGESHAMLLLLADAKPFYSVVEVEVAWSGRGWVIEDERHHENINHAVADFADSGGDA